MSTAGRSASDRQLLDPDALAALEEERDFLLGSLRDLEREYEAGDIDEDDYLTLRDDYTHRAARTIEAIQQRHDARTAAAPDRKWSRTLLGILGVVAFAVVAGWGVAQAAGLRTAGEGLTGDVRLTVGQTLFRCQQLVNSGEIRDSLECYDGVIADNPDNVEAITYRPGPLLVSPGFPILPGRTSIRPWRSTPTTPTHERFARSSLAGGAVPKRPSPSSTPSRPAIPCRR